MPLIRSTLFQDEDFRTIWAGDLLVNDSQIDARMAQRPDAAITGDNRGVHVNNLGRLGLRAHINLPLGKKLPRILAWMAAFPKLALPLALAGCAAIPFGVPQPYPGHPIITSGYFSLPDGARQPYRLYPAQGPVQAVVL